MHVAMYLNFKYLTKCNNCLLIIVLVQTKRQISVNPWAK